MINHDACRSWCLHAKACFPCGSRSTLVWIFGGWHPPLDSSKFIFAGETPMQTRVFVPGTPEVRCRHAKPAGSHLENRGEHTGSSARKNWATREGWENYQKVGIQWDILDDLHGYLQSQKSEVVTCKQVTMDMRFNVDQCGLLGGRSSGIAISQTSAEMRSWNLGPGQVDSGTPIEVLSHRLYTLW